MIKLDERNIEGRTCRGPGQKLFFMIRTLTRDQFVLANLHVNLNIRHY